MILFRISSGAFTPETLTPRELVRQCEPCTCWVVHFHLRNGRSRRYFNSMDISRSVFANFVTRAILDHYLLVEPELGCWSDIVLAF